MYQQPSSSHISRRWRPADDALLQHLRVIELRTWPEIAATLGRTTNAVQGRYYQLKIADGASFEDWDAGMDEYIIAGRGQRQNIKAIALEMGLPAEAVQGRWYELQQQKKVPDDVMAVWKRKGEAKWSEKEDEVLVQMWIDGKDKNEIMSCGRFEGKYQCDVKERFQVLLREKGPTYTRLMGMQETRPMPHALDKALGKKKYAWM